MYLGRRQAETSTSSTAEGNGTGSRSGTEPRTPPGGSASQFQALRSGFTRARPPPPRWRSLAAPARHPTPLGWQRARLRVELPGPHGLDAAKPAGRPRLDDAVDDPVEK